MIPKGLKVGDTFEDGGLVYRVKKVVGENYSAEWVGETPPEPLTVKQPKITEDDVNSDYLSMPYAMLKKICAEKGLDATGKKTDLIARLEG